jgi:hypothetical protein
MSYNTLIYHIFYHGQRVELIASPIWHKPRPVSLSYQSSSSCPLELVMGHTKKSQNTPHDDEEFEGGDRAPLLSVALHLDDLMPDRTGAVVLQADGERLEIQLEDWDEILTRGIAPEDTRSEHFDVSGMDYVTFANGVTLYFPAGDILLTLKPTVAAKTSPPSMSLFQLIDRELHHKRPVPARRHSPKDES